MIRPQPSTLVWNGGPNEIVCTPRVCPEGASSRQATEAVNCKGRPWPARSLPEVPCLIHYTVLYCTILYYTRLVLTVLCVNSTMQHNTTQHVISQHNTLLCYASDLLCDAMTYYNKPYDATICDAMLRYATLCYAMPCYATLYYTILHYPIRYCNIL